MKPLELKSRKLQPKGNMGSEKPVLCAQRSIKEGFIHSTMISVK